MVIDDGPMATTTTLNSTTSTTSITTTGTTSITMMATMGVMGDHIGMDIMAITEGLRQLLELWKRTLSTISTSVFSIT